MALALLVFLLFFQIACRKDRKGSGDQLPGTNTLSVLDARKYFYNTLRKKPIGNLMIMSETDRANSKLYPDWFKAKSIKTSLYDMVEVPVVSKNMLITLYSFTSKGEPSRKPDLTVMSVCFKRLIIYKNKSGIVNQRIVTYVPDREYLLKHKNDATNNYINKFDPDFSGYLEYADWSGKIYFVLRMLNGKAVRKVTVISNTIHLNTGLQVNSTGTLKMDDDCMDCEPIYQESCISAGDDPNVEPTCTENIVGQNCVSYPCDPGGTGGTDDPCLDPANMNTALCGGTDPDPSCGTNCNPPPSPPDDPCNSTKTAAASKANSMVGGNSSIATAFATATKNAKDGFESAFHIDNTSNNAANPNYIASDPVKTASEGDPYSSTNVTSQTVAIGHNHDASSFPAPSYYDIYGSGETAVSSNGQITTNYTLSANAEYALIVTDVNAFKAFFANYPESNLEIGTDGKFTGDLNGKSTIGIDVNNVDFNATALYLATHAADPNNPTDAEITTANIAGYEAALVYMLSNYSTGVTLLKADSNGIFQAYHATSTVDSTTGKTYYSTSPCN